MARRNIFALTLKLSTMVNKDKDFIHYSLYFDPLDMTTTSELMVRTISKKSIR